MRQTVPMNSDVHDYVIVGAGSAGCVLANRLSADGTHSVLLLEAGAVDKKTEIHIPAAFSTLFRGEADWNYDTVPQEQLDGRQVYWPRGKVLGGSSSINAMMWVRGFAADYDRWAEHAGSDWSWQALLPHFKTVERITGTDDPDHGTEGAMAIMAQRSPRSSTHAFLEAVGELGMKVEAPNTARPDGFSQTMVTQRGGGRVSAVDAYLTPAKGRTNLSVRTGAHVTRVLFDGKRATGVEYIEGGTKRTVTARREVILAGGAINTPQLLMLSGIGDPQQLAAHGIDVVASSPEVGQNLKDHLLSGLIVEAAGDTLFTARSLPQVAQYLLRRRGMLSSNVAEAYGFVRSRPDLELPDLEIIFAPVAFIKEGLETHPGHGITVASILLQPESSGTISLASADPLVKALIDPRYLSDPGGKDRETLLAGIAWCDRILKTERMRRITTGRYIAPEDANDLAPGELYERAVNGYAQTLYHPVGTARMGLDEASVVDPELRVRGVEGLRVADASVMPGQIRGHTNAPSLVIGERAAALLVE